MTNLAGNLARTAEQHPDALAMKRDDFGLTHAQLRDVAVVRAPGSTADSETLIGA